MWPSVWDGIRVNNTEGTLDVGDGGKSLGCVMGWRMHPFTPQMGWTVRKRLQMGLVGFCSF